MVTRQDLLEQAGPGDPFDRHVFASAVAIAHAEPRPLAVGLGLSVEGLSELTQTYFPRVSALRVDGEGGETPLAPEEADLRGLLLEYRSHGDRTAEWLAHIVARRSLAANHLWQDLGLRNRDELNGLLRRHFAGLADLNARNMKWKKFLYRQLCQREGVPICKSPNCEVCTDFAVCFGPEA